MKIILALALALVLLFSSAASAKQEMVTAGQYIVSFDMNTGDGYSIKAAGPVGSEHDSNPIGYTISITGKNRSAIISISPEDYSTDTSALAQKQALEEAFDQFQAKNGTQFSNLTVDGQEAAVGVGTYLDDTPIVVAVYHKSIRPPGVLLKVMVTSSYPWEGVTDELLKSLRVEYYPLEHQGVQADNSTSVPGTVNETAQST